jgi:hypothetical protein
MGGTEEEERRAHEGRGRGRRVQGKCLFEKRGRSAAERWREEAVRVVRAGRPSLTLEERVSQRVEAAYEQEKQEVEEHLARVEVEAEVRLRVSYR